MSRLKDQPPPLQPPPITRRSPPAPPPSSPSSSAMPWKRLGLSTAAVLWVGVGVGVGAVAVWYFAFRSSKDGRQRSSGGRGGGAAVPRDVVERADALIELIGRGDIDELDVAEWRGYLAAACRGEEGVSEEGEGAEVSAEGCLALIRLLTSYHTVRNLLLMQEGAAVPPRDLQLRMAQLEAEQSDDLTKAWELLQRPSVQHLHRQPSPSAAALAAADDAAAVVGASDLRLLALEIAQRLKSSEKLKAAFGSLMELEQSDMSDEQVLAAFMTAPLLGRWKDTRTLGQRLIERKGPTAMDEFHAAALQEAVYPDYALLYLRSAEWQSLSHAEVPPLAWEKYDVAQILVRHDQSFNPDPAQNAQLQQIVAGQREQREISPPRGHYPFIVTGAIARMQSPFIVELPCVGFYSPDKFSLAAYAIIPAQSDPNSGLDMPATWVDLLIECTKESVVDGGAERTFTGFFQVKEHIALPDAQPGAAQTPNRKGPLTVMHQFHIDLAIRRAQP